MVELYCRVASIYNFVYCIGAVLGSQVCPAMLLLDECLYKRIGGGFQLSAVKWMIVEYSLRW